MNYIELECDKILEKVNAIDVNTLLEKAKACPEAAFDSIALNQLVFDRDGDSYNRLILKKYRNEISFIAKSGFTHGRDDDWDTAELEFEDLEGEKWFLLYNLLATEVQKLITVDKDSCYECYLTFKNQDIDESNNCSTHCVTPTVLAIFSEFVNGIEYGRERHEEIYLWMAHGADDGVIEFEDNSSSQSENGASDTEDFEDDDL